MSKEQRRIKETRKKPALTPKEKKVAKRDKKAGNEHGQSINDTLS